ncbi:hypothetical protein Fmac_006856 [Flemingia macrophylla]|uniref:Uncharacterized protein n=1 Tax=Flemingia macrophylla TaxID=520843 RepID=A0ABD1NCB6_9FABA
MGGAGAFWGTRVMEIVKKHDSGGLVWKRIKLTTTRKANAKKRLHRVWQVLDPSFTASQTKSSFLCLPFSFHVYVFAYLKNEAVLKACSEPSPSAAASKPQDNTAHT